MKGLMLFVVNETFEMSQTVGCIVVIRCAVPQVVLPRTQVTLQGPRMSLSKRRSSSVGNKARLVASHQSTSVRLSSSLALNRTQNTAGLAEHS